MNTEHAPLAPSSAPQWAFCSGSVPANLNAPDIECERTRAGTASHWVGGEALNSWLKHRKQGVTDCTNWIGETAPNGVVVDEEMAEGAQQWVDDVLELSATYGAPHGLAVEQRVKMPNIHPLNWGTLDTRGWFPETNTLYAWEYKFGHREVPVFENYQLIDYVAGLIQEPMNAKTTVVLRVVQPFCYYARDQIREWKTSLGELTPYFNRLTDQAHEAMTTPTLTAGLHCRDCAAINRCPTARRAGYSVITYAGEAYDLETLRGSDLAVERDILRVGLTLVKARLEAVEDQIYASVKKGDHSSGLTVQSKEGRLKWDVPTGQAIALGWQFGADLSKPGAVTPLQAIKKIPKDLRPAFESVLRSSTSRPSSGLELVKLEDSRTARAFKPRSN